MEVNSIILMLGYLCSVSSGEPIDWCATLLRCRNLKNTLCAFGKEEVNKGNCTDQKDLVQTSKELRAYWLALHNTFRDQVAAGYVPGLPSAANMMQLAYDGQLTMQARRWAFQCKYEAGKLCSLVWYEDDPCSRSPMYENMEPETVYNETRLLGVLVNDTRAAVLTRFLENVNGYKLFPSRLIDKFDATSFDTYQQVNFVFHAFALVRDIGASLILYKWSEGGSLHPFLKSNTYYGPPIDKGPLYARGQPCSQCPDGYRCYRRSTYPHLCANARDPKTEEYADGLPGAQQKAANGAANLHICSSVLLASVYFQVSVS